MDLTVAAPTNLLPSLKATTAICRTKTGSHRFSLLRVNNRTDLLYSSIAIIYYFNLFVKHKIAQKPESENLPQCHSELVSESSNATDQNRDAEIDSA